jgi:hypothetical protein
MIGGPATKFPNEARLFMVLEQGQPTIVAASTLGLAASIKINERKSGKE